MEIICSQCGKGDLPIYKIFDIRVCSDCMASGLNGFLDQVNRQTQNIVSEYTKNLNMMKEKFDKALTEAVKKASVSKGKKMSKEALERFTQQYRDDADVDELLQIFEAANQK